MNSKMQFKAEKVTMGDLIVVITDAVLEVARDEDMAYKIAGPVFMRLLAVSDPETADNLLAEVSLNSKRVIVLENNSGQIRSHENSCVAKAVCSSPSTGLLLAHLSF